MFAGIDIGGANTKIANSDGSIADSFYAPLWRDSTVLYRVLHQIRDRFSNVEGVGVVMTGELCDCYKTRREGVISISNAVSAVFEDAEFFDRNGRFHRAIKADPLAFASTNWLASAKLIASLYRDTDLVFVDIGSTTTDVIPIVRGEIKAKRTDLERLHAHELLYSGILRTNVAAILNRVVLNGKAYATSSELFAIAADAYLVLGDISRTDYRCECPNRYAFDDDEEAKSVESAMQRLARVVCSDLEDIGDAGAIDIAAQVKNAQMERLVNALSIMKERYGIERVVSAGTGEFLIKEAVEAVEMELLAPLWNSRLAAVLPAYAVAKLLSECYC